MPAPRSTCHTPESAPSILDGWGAQSSFLAHKLARTQVCGTPPNSNKVEEMKQKSMRVLNALDVDGDGRLYENELSAAISVRMRLGLYCPDVRAG